MKDFTIETERMPGYRFVTKYPGGHYLALLDDGSPVLIDESFEVFAMDTSSPILYDDYDSPRRGIRFWVKGLSPVPGPAEDWTAVPLNSALDLAHRYGMPLADYSHPSRGYTVAPWEETK